MATQYVNELNETIYIIVHKIIHKIFSYIVHIEDLHSYIVVIHIFVV